MRLGLYFPGKISTDVTGHSEPLWGDGGFRFFAVFG